MSDFGWFQDQYERELLGSTWRVRVSNGDCLVTLARLHRTSDGKGGFWDILVLSGDQTGDVVERLFSLEGPERSLWERIDR